MAYTDSERNICAHAIASEGSIAAALRYIIATYTDSVVVAIHDISESTLRRMMREPKFQDLVAAEGKRIADARALASADCAREKFRAELSGSFLERIQTLEAEGWRQFDQLKKLMDDPDISINAKGTFWQNIMTFVMKLKNQNVPAIGEYADAERLIQSYRDVLVPLLGLPRFQEVNRDVAKRFNELLDTARAHAAELAPGSAVASGTSGSPAGTASVPLAECGGTHAAQSATPVSAG